ncbi:potassium channel family protein [Anaerotalea alkaliphila]|uniref:TrkA family potassium uptake protein n=1 Tax=Anaerotalea alkaliphila TaxID=2662126 RepID=A0A7X5HWA0_9FIRM|nr:TrkA family potassium uptake protein [Anaerotalea alkaliphila]NDL67820.1 TrkA family potassium uptake protein [Anaerotalea alkaliphila]
MTTAWTIPRQAPDTPESERDRFVLIAGCGGFGRKLAQVLSGGDRSITLIDLSPEAFVALPPEFEGRLLAGDATDVALLEQAGIATADMLVAATDNDNTNIFLAEIAKTIYGVKDVASRLYDGDKTRAYKDLGIRILNPVELATLEFEKLFDIPEKGEEPA